MLQKNPCQRPRRFWKQFFRWCAYRELIVPNLLLISPWNQITHYKELFYFHGLLKPYVFFCLSLPKFHQNLFIMTRTPRKPIRTPKRRPPFIFSSEVIKCATATVNKGVVALRIDATLEATCAWPQTIRLNGTMLFKIPIPPKANQIFRLLGIFWPLRLTINKSVNEAKATRPTTMVNVGNSLTATPLKKKDPTTNPIHGKSWKCWWLVLKTWVHLWWSKWIR